MAKTMPENFIGVRRKPTAASSRTHPKSNKIVKQQSSKTATTSSKSHGKKKRATTDAPITLDKNETVTFLQNVMQAAIDKGSLAALHMVRPWVNQHDLSPEGQGNRDAEQKGVKTQETSKPTKRKAVSLSGSDSSSSDHDTSSAEDDSASSVESSSGAHSDSNIASASDSASASESASVSKAASRSNKIAPPRKKVKLNPSTTKLGTVPPSSNDDKSNSTGDSSESAEPDLDSESDSDSEPEPDLDSDSDSGSQPDTSETSSSSSSASSDHDKDKNTPRQSQKAKSGTATTGSTAHLKEKRNSRRDEASESTTTLEGSEPSVTSSSSSESSSDSSSSDASDSTEIHASDKDSAAATNAKLHDKTPTSALSADDILTYIKAPTDAELAEHPDAKGVKVELAATASNVERLNKQRQPFSRIPADIKVDPRFASNRYVSYEYADRAHEDLIKTKGKGFTKEKNKKKRGSFRGGRIDVSGGRGIKFED